MARRSTDQLSNKELKNCKKELKEAHENVDQVIFDVILDFMECVLKELNGKMSLQSEIKNHLWRIQIFFLKILVETVLVK